MTTAQIVKQVMNPQTTNLGAVGVALVEAARKTWISPGPPS